MGQEKSDATASPDGNPPLPQEAPKGSGSTLTAEIDLELTRRDIVNIKRELQVVYVMRKELIVKGEIVPVDFTFRIFERGAKEKAIKRAERKEKKRRKALGGNDARNTSQHAEGSGVHERGRDETEDRAD